MLNRSAVTRCAALAACALLARGQPPGAERVIVNATAIDAQGQPVTDLTSTDFQILDEGKLRPIASLESSAMRSSGRPQPPTTVILFDLLNSVRGHREYISTLIVRALEPLETADSVYLYLLTNRGDVYPVRVLIEGARDTQEDVKQAAAPWTGQIHPLLD